MVFGDDERYEGESDVKRCDKAAAEYFVRAKISSENDSSTEILSQTSNRSAWPATVRSDLSYRYFFDISEAVKDISVVHGAGEAGVVSSPVHWSGTIYYVEMDLTGTKIYPAGRAESERQSVSPSARRLVLQMLKLRIICLSHSN